ncbi:MAG TPA: AarF/ABC1/UbiB kinase family protein, partial [Acidimicrobiales bacterium]|nr:AarF/ABC1/UbiB kinase family protein [Acidimicrobiales bacterium]
MTLVRRSLLASAAAIGITLWWQQRSSRRSVTEPVAGSGGRAARTIEMASMGSRLGTTVAVNRARHAFASSARKDTLDRELELATSEQVAQALGGMKGALMKVGQMASYLDEGLPEHLRLALAQLQQDAPPMSEELAAGVVERELGQSPERVFEEWDPTPIAAASIGQVHRALTRDGRAVAVKVQYPGVADAVRSDLDNAGLLGTVVHQIFPGLDTGALVTEISARVIEELDYQREAENQRLFAGYFRGHPFISIPGVVDELSTGRVLTTELATGVRFDEMEGWPQDERNLAGEAIFRFVFRSLYRLRAFNGDPHPGNYLFNPGGRVTFLDFGLVKRFDQPETEVLQSMIQTMVLEPDPDAFRRIVEDVGLLKRGLGIPTAELVDYYRHFYDLVMVDGVTTFSKEYA